MEITFAINNKYQVLNSTHHRYRFFTSLRQVGVYFFNIHNWHLEDF